MMSIITIVYAVSISTESTKMVSYPQGQVVLDVQTPNSIVHFNFLKEVVI